MEKHDITHDEIVITKEPVSACLVTWRVLSDLMDAAEERMQAESNDKGFDCASSDRS